MKNLLIALVIAVFGFGAGVLYKPVTSHKYKVNSTFCVENGVIPKFTAQVVANFSFNNESVYVVGPVLSEEVPLQFLSVIPEEAIDYWVSNCEL